MSGTRLKHVPVIDPSWPWPFCERSWWDGKDVVGQASADILERNAGKNPSSHPAPQATVLASLPDQHATGRREDREP